MPLAPGVSANRTGPASGENVETQRTQRILSLVRRDSAFSAFCPCESFSNKLTVLMTVGFIHVLNVWFLFITSQNKTDANQNREAGSTE